MNSKSHSRILLTGASGFFGWNLAQVIENSEQLFGWHHQNPCPWLPNQQQVDLSIERDIVTAFNSCKPTAVVHAAAVSQPNECQQNPVKSRAINVNSTVTLANLCKERNIPMVFTSSDLVYDGEKGNYNEDDITNPISAYAEQKVDAEVRSKRTHEKLTICRLPMMFGEYLPERNTTFINLLHSLNKGEQQNLFSDEFRSMARCQSVAKGVLQCLGNKGTYNLGGYEKLSRYDFGIEVCRAFHFKEPLINACKQADVKMSAPRPKDVSMNNDKAKALGYNPQPVSVELLEIKASLRKLGVSFS